MHPTDFTPRWLAGLDGAICVYCASCREVREIPLRKLVEAGRDKQPIARMVFRCQTCRHPGEASVNWRDARGDWRHSYVTGETRPRERLPNVYDRP